MEKAEDLYPLVGVGHHGNQEVDQDDGGDQHVKGKHYLEEIHQPRRVVRRHVQFVVAEKRILVWMRFLPPLTC